MNHYRHIHRSMDEAMSAARQRPMAIRLNPAAYAPEPCPEDVSLRWVALGFALSIALWLCIIGAIYFLL